MVRVRLYGLVLSLPIILLLCGVIFGFATDSLDAYKISIPLIGAGLGLQLIGNCLSEVWQIPICDRSELGPFFLRWQTLARRQMQPVRP